MKSEKRTAMVAIATAFAVAGVGATGSEAFAAQVAAKAKPKVSVVAKPAVLRAGAQAKVTVKVTGARGRALRLDLQQRVGRTWVTKQTRPIKRSGRFALTYHAPALASTHTLRVRLRRAAKRLAQSASFTVTITAARATATIGSGAGDPGSPATPGAGGALAPGVPAPATVVIAPSAVQSVPDPGVPGIVRITGSVDLKPGDVIASDIGPNAPIGFLRTVVSASFDGASTVVETTQATLPDAIPEGSFDQAIDLGEQDSQARASGADTGTSTPQHSRMIHRAVRTVLECESSAKIVVAGDVGIKADVEFSGGWSVVHGPRARMVATAQASSQLSASAAAAAECSISPKKLFERTLTPISFAVGPIPVVIVPKLAVYLSADGKVEAHVEAEVHTSFTAKAGLSFEKGSLSPISSFEKNFGYTPPSPQGSATLGAQLSPTVDMLMYGVAGPEVVFDAGLRLDAQTDATPAWTLKAPVSLTAKLDAPVLKISTGTVTVFEHDFLLAQAGETQLQGFIRFDEFPAGIVIGDQYADKGVVFDDAPFITGDGANPTSPVLSGATQFTSPITGHFVLPGTSTPTTVNTLQLDAGYIDNPGSVEIVAHLAGGQTRTAVADHLGIDQISIAARNITGFTVQAVSQEDAGFAIDNLGFSK
jgi:hypothetical protein